jgi:hypothetical protein
MKYAAGKVVKEGVNYHFLSEKTGKVNNTIGYVKYINKVDTNVDLGFIDCYPVNEFLLEKLTNENMPCFVELIGDDIKLHESKLVLII